MKQHNRINLITNIDKHMYIMYNGRKAKECVIYEYYINC